MSLTDKCQKCKGAGWVWGYELDGGEPEPTDTRYSCDACGGTGLDCDLNREDVIALREQLAAERDALSASHAALLGRLYGYLACDSYPDMLALDRQTRTAIHAAEKLLEAKP